MGLTTMPNLELENGRLVWNIPIVNKDGTPTNEFMLKWLAQSEVNGEIPELKTPDQVSAVLDILGDTPGALLWRSPSGWVLLAPGTDTQFLTINSDTPAWEDRQFRLIGGTPGRKPLNLEVLFDNLMYTDDHLPAGLTGSLLKCEVAPTADWTMTMTKNGVSIGTGTILAGQTTGSFTAASAVTFTDGDHWKCASPATDATISGVSYLIAGTRKK